MKYSTGFSMRRGKGFNTEDGLIHTRNKDFYQALSVQLKVVCLFLIVSKLYFGFFFSKLKPGVGNRMHTKHKLTGL